MPHVIIIGCGFGGLAAARKLAGTQVSITLIDRSNHHLFQPLLYQVATAGLSALSISAPIRSILSAQHNLTILMAEVMSINVLRKIVILEDNHSISYDYLILAAGSTHSYFGHNEWRAIAPGLKTLADAFNIRHRILTAFEYAEREINVVNRAQWLTFIVIGAGPTGVEMAGMLIEIAKHTMRGEFRRIDLQQTKVILLEGSNCVLSFYPADLSEKARKQLIKLGVDVRINSRVIDINNHGVCYKNEFGEQKIISRTIIWTAGVAASPLSKSLNTPLDATGRVLVNNDLSIQNYPEVFVIGDLAAVKSAGKLVPGVSPAAKQMGRLAAYNILKRIAFQPTKIFYYHDYGMLATIGRKAAVAKIGKIKFTGYIAWLFWFFVHVYFLIGFRNRIIVISEWAWSYFTFKRNARILIKTIDTTTDKFD